MYIPKNRAVDTMKIISDTHKIHTSQNKNNLLITRSTALGASSLSGDTACSTLQSLMIQRVIHDPQ